MSVDELIKELKTIVKVHPEAKDAEVWASNWDENVVFHILNIGYDKKHKPKRLKLES